MRAAAAAAHSHTVAGNSPLLTHEMRYTFAINAICFQIGHSCSNGIFLIKIIPHCVGCVLLNISGAATNCYKRNEVEVKCRSRNVPVTLYYKAMINCLPFSLKECEWTGWRAAMSSEFALAFLNEMGNSLNFCWETRGNRLSVSIF